MKEEFELKAIEICKKVLDALHEKRFADVINLVDESKIEDLEEFLTEYVQGTLDDNDFDSIDRFGEPRNPNAEKPLNIFEYEAQSGKNGFCLTYMLASGGELVDLMLQLDFIYIDNGNEIKVVFKDVDPM